MSKRDIIEVKSWRDIPVDFYPGSGVEGIYDSKTGKIYIVKGSPESVKYHEEYHALKRHPDKPRDFANYVRQEIEAHLYSYGKTGRPKHLLQKLRAIFNDLIWHVYRVNPRKALDTIRVVIFEEYDVPPGWKEDFFKLRKESRKIYSQIK